jgi:hypothetical protein
VILCVTGSRFERPAAQVAAVARHLAELALYQLTPTTELHHGGATGADRQAHELVRDLWGAAVRVVIHPASGVAERWCDWSDADVLLAPRKALERNAAIVASLDATPLVVLPAAPERDDPRSGTWATVRLARKAHKAVLIVWPDGTTTGEANTP